MPPGGARFDESTVPPWTRGDFQGGLGRGNHPTPALRDRRRCASHPRWLDPSPTNTAHQPPPPWPLATASTPRLRRGAYLQWTL
jgi:hypothetical protein